MAMVDFNEEQRHANDEDNARRITNNPDNHQIGRDALSFPDLANSGHGHYVGRVTELKGRGAMLHAQGHEVIAQFDDYDTKLCYGWHKFNKADFVFDVYITYI